MAAPPLSSACKIEAVPMTALPLSSADKIEEVPPLPGVSPYPIGSRGTARSDSVESGTYDFYGESSGTLEDLSWMYDRKAVEFVNRTDEEEGTYDMFF